MSEHIYKPFDAELRSLKDMILAMGGLVEAHISDSLRALVERDSARARSVIEADRQVNQMELAIDELCVRMLVLRQPAASDLRFIAAALKIVTDLERIGDLAVNMGERALALCDEPPLRAVVDLPAMASSVQKMLRDALDAFVTRDDAKAETVLAADAEIDKALVQIFEDVRAEMKKDPANVDRGISTIFYAKHLERLADHTCNVAEMVVYLVRGQDVRHKTNR
ncbi:MAG: phosphate signaling complex protein PhoU [Myxococcales bacterium]|nr:phosphate signaling complex protein PhoU [Myxococcales bacterium]